jgi:hypothetical protein
MKTLTIATTCLLALLLVAPVSAQEATGEPLPETTYDFADDIVEGDLVRPDGELIEGQSTGRAQSLINIREHFIDKMIESVDEF